MTFDAHIFISFRLQVKS